MLPNWNARPPKFKWSRLLPTKASDSWKEPQEQIEQNVFSTKNPKYQPTNSELVLSAQNTNKQDKFSPLTFKTPQSLGPHSTNDSKYIPMLPT